MEKVQPTTKINICPVLLLIEFLFIYVLKDHFKDPSWNTILMCTAIKLKTDFVCKSNKSHMNTLLLI